MNTNPGKCEKRGQLSKNLAVRFVRPGLNDGNSFAERAETVLTGCAKMSTFDGYCVLILSIFALFWGEVVSFAPFASVFFRSPTFARVDPPNAPNETVTPGSVGPSATLRGLSDVWQRRSKGLLRRAEWP